MFFVSGALVPHPDEISRPQTLLPDCFDGINVSSTFALALPVKISAVHSLMSSYLMWSWTPHAAGTGTLLNTRLIRGELPSEGTFRDS